MNKAFIFDIQIWGILFLVSVVAGIVAEFFWKRRGHTPAEESREEIL